MSGTSTPSRKLSSTTIRVLPPSRRKAFSCSSAQMRELERKVNKRNCLTAVPEGHHKQSGASIFAGLRVADHRALAVIDLGFFSRRGEDHRAWLQWLVSAQLADEAFDRLIAPVEPILGYQVLPDRRGIATAAQTQFDCLPERLAGAGGRNAFGIFYSRGAQLHAKPGGHLNGRF